MAEIVAAIGARQAQRPVEVFCVDASHVTKEPYVQDGWFRQGQHVKVPTPRQRHSTTLFGAWPLHTQRFSWKRAARGTSARFLEFLHQLHQRFPDALLLLILDNVTIHQSRAVTQFLTQHDWIILETWRRIPRSTIPLNASGGGEHRCKAVRECVLEKTSRWGCAIRNTHLN